MSGLFYNVHPHVAEARLVGQWLGWQPPAALVMNNPGLARRLHGLRPEALVIHRRTPDDRVDDLGKPGEWLARMMAEVPEPGIVLYAGNEIHGDPGISAWTLEAMERASQAGRKLCILNCGTGGPEDEEWWGGMPDTSPYTLPAARIGGLEKVARAWAVSQHYLGLHEYADGLDWRRDRGWQVGRLERHLDTFAKMGIPVARSSLRRRLVITEATFDSVQNSAWKGARWLPAEEAARQMIEMDREVYQGMPVLMYCLGHNGDAQWRKFRLDYEGAEAVGLDEWGRAFQSAVGAYMEGAAMTMTTRQVTVKQTVKKRRDAGLNTLQTGTLAAGAYTLAVSEAQVDADGYVWRQFREDETVDEALNPMWWSALGKLDGSETYIVVEPPAEPEPEPPSPPTPLPEGEGSEPEPMSLAQWMIVLRAWQETTAGMIVALEEMETRLRAFDGVLVETIAALEDAA